MLVASSRFPAQHTVPIDQVLAWPGYYIAFDPQHPLEEVPLRSFDGKVYCVHVPSLDLDRALDPTGFSPACLFIGPLTREQWVA